jgi:hypothetical protein
MSLVSGYSTVLPETSYGNSVISMPLMPEMQSMPEMPEIINRVIATKPPILTTKVNMRRQGKSRLSTNEVLSSGRDFDKRYTFFMEQNDPFNVNILNKDGDTALGVAILNQDVSMIDWLLNNGIDPNLGKFDVINKVFQFGIQIYGSYQNIQYMIEQLISAGKNVTTKNLEWAVEKNNGLLISPLLDQDTYFNTNGSLKPNTNLPENIRYLIEITKDTSKRTWGNYFRTFNPIKISRTLTNKNKSEILKLKLRKLDQDALYTGEFNNTPEQYRGVPKAPTYTLTKEELKAIGEYHKGGKHCKTHHRRRTMRKKHTKTRRHHRK